MREYSAVKGLYAMNYKMSNAGWHGKPIDSTGIVSRPAAGPAEGDINLVDSFAHCHLISRAAGVRIVRMDGYGCATVIASDTLETEMLAADMAI